MKNQKTFKNCDYLDRVTIIPQVFTPEECKKIIDTGLNDWKEEDSMVEGVRGGEPEVDSDYRNVTLFVPTEQTEPNEWLFSTIFNAVMNSNYQPTGYNFTLEGFAEPPNLMRYQAANINKHGTPGKYDWHMDIGSGPPSLRKLSYSIILNPDEYEGGELYFNTGEKFEEPCSDQYKSGNIILFPSYLIHRVSEITSGTRYAIVGWMHGPSFV